MFSMELSNLFQISHEKGQKLSTGDVMFTVCLKRFPSRIIKIPCACYVSPYKVPREIGPNAYEFGYSMKSQY